MQVLWQGETIPIDLSFVEFVNTRSGQKIQLCYHCHKCGAGCPVASHMDYTPDKLFRMAQLGLKRQVLRSTTIWLCSACHTCATRCPNDIDVTGVMDALKQMAVEERIKSPQKVAALFHRAFLANLRTFGQIHEASLMAVLKLRTLNLFSDLKLGVKMFKKGKIAVFPKRIRGTREMRKLFGKQGGGRRRPKHGLETVVLSGMFPSRDGQGIRPFDNRSV
jgi:heterodisulfide reductase subunit C2